LSLSERSERYTGLVARLAVSIFGTSVVLVKCGNSQQYRGFQLLQVLQALTGQHLEPRNGNGSYPSIIKIRKKPGFLACPRGPEAIAS
jgi:hypothetical protein